MESSSDPIKQRKRSLQQYILARKRQRLEAASSDAAVVPSTRTSTAAGSKLSALNCESDKYRKSPSVDDSVLDERQDDDSTASVATSFGSGNPEDNVTKENRNIQDGTSSRSNASTDSAKTASTITTWTCDRCTLSNTLSKRRCEACNARRPPLDTDSSLIARSPASLPSQNSQKYTTTKPAGTSHRRVSHQPQEVPGENGSSTRREKETLGLADSLKSSTSTTKTPAAPFVNTNRTILAKAAALVSPHELCHQVVQPDDPAKRLVKVSRNNDSVVAKEKDHNATTADPNVPVRQDTLPAVADDTLAAVQGSRQSNVVATQPQHKKNPTKVLKGVLPRTDCGKRLDPGTTGPDTTTTGTKQTHAAAAPRC